MFIIEKSDESKEDSLEEFREKYSPKQVSQLKVLKELKNFKIGQIMLLKKVIWLKSTVKQELYREIQIMEDMSD